MKPRRSGNPSPSGLAHHRTAELQLGIHPPGNPTPPGPAHHRTAELQLGIHPPGNPAPPAAPPKPGWHSRGYLPHCDADGLTQHLTFHLADSLPTAALEYLEATISEMPEDERKRQRLVRVHDLLDAGHGCCVLRRPEAAEIVQGALLHFHGERYRLLAWAVMPNHVHVLLRACEGHRLARIVQSWKSYTARRINALVLKETGTAECRAGARRSIARQPDTPKKLWQRDYWDRYVRDETHFQTVVRYIEDNPTNARLVAAAEDWPWSSAHLRSPT